MASIGDNRSGLDDHPFSYVETGQGKVLISWRGTEVTVLKGSKAISFLGRISGLGVREQQMVMAKITGNFKRGNEKRA